MSANSVNLKAAPLLAALWVVSACAPPRTAPPAGPGEWRGVLGGPERAAYAGVAFTGAPRIDWRKGYGRGIAVALQVHAPLLIATTTGRTVVAINAETGMQYWSRTFSGPIAGSALRRNDRAYVATGGRENRIHAITLPRGRRIWSSRRIGPFRVEPVLLEDRLVAVTENGIVAALGESDGALLWRTALGAPPAAPPVPHEASVFIATVRDSLYRIRTADGQVTGRVALPGTASAPALIRDGHLILPVFPNHVVTVDLERFAVSEPVALDAPVLAAPVPAGAGVALLTRDARVYRLEAGGRTVRLIADLGGSASASFAGIGTNFAVGRLDGALFFLDPAGRLLWRQDFDDSIAAPVAAADGVLFVPLLHGDVVRVEAE